MFWAGTNETIPSGWIKANGAEVSRTVYANLFAAIGTAWGAGNGSTTFNVPDLRGEFLRGWDDARGIDTGRALASQQAGQNLSHNHGHDGYFVSSYTTYDGDVDGSTAATGYDKTTIAGTIYSQGGEFRPRNMPAIALIKY